MCTNLLFYYYYYNYIHLKDALRTVAAVTRDPIAMPETPYSRGRDAYYCCWCQRPNSRARDHPVLQRTRCILLLPLLLVPETQLPCKRPRTSEDALYTAAAGARDPVFQRIC